MMRDGRWWASGAVRVGSLVMREDRRCSVLIRCMGCDGMIVMGWCDGLISMRWRCDGVIFVEWWAWSEWAAEKCWWNLWSENGWWKLWGVMGWLEVTGVTGWWWAWCDGGKEWWREKWVAMGGDGMIGSWWQVMLVSAEPLRVVMTVTYGEGGWWGGDEWWEVIGVTPIISVRRSRIRYPGRTNQQRPYKDWHNAASRGEVWGGRSSMLSCNYGFEGERRCVVMEYGCSEK